MTADHVISLYGDLEDAHIEIWLDGGWGVDALLGRQTRPHKDLDIAIAQADVPKLCKILSGHGYREARRHHSHNFVLRDEAGHEVDVHAFVRDRSGNVVSGVRYPADSLTGTGTINDRVVRCIAPEWMVKFHSGYELQEKDFRDVSALCEKFGIALPGEFARFQSAQDRSR
jgi:lincosamide nucleotidyltransferase A/C/D/E